MSRLPAKISIKYLVYILFIAAQMLNTTSVLSDTIKIRRYEWEVKFGVKLVPGPNSWKPSNVSVDSKGFLHLKISNENGNWSYGEIAMTKRLGFGTYQFQGVGRLDQFDKNIVL